MLFHENILYSSTVIWITTVKTTKGGQNTFSYAKMYAMIVSKWTFIALLVMDENYSMWTKFYNMDSISGQTNISYNNTSISEVLLTVWDYGEMSISFT